MNRESRNDKLSSLVKHCDGAVESMSQWHAVSHNFIRSKAAAILPALFNTSLFLALLLNLIILLGYGVKTPVRVFGMAIVCTATTDLGCECDVLLTVHANHDAT